MTETPEKLRLGGLALRNGLALFGPTAWAAAVRTADGGIRVASGQRPRLRAADRVPLVRGVGRMSEMLATLPSIPAVETTDGSPRSRRPTPSAPTR